FDQDGSEDALRARAKLRESSLDLARVEVDNALVRERREAKAADPHPPLVVEREIAADQLQLFREQLAERNALGDDEGSAGPERDARDRGLELGEVGDEVIHR